MNSRTEDAPISALFGGACRIDELRLVHATMVTAQRSFWDRVPDDRTARMHFQEFRRRLPATATQFECRVVCESPTHLEARYTIDGHLYRLVGLHSGSTVRTTLDEVRETSTNFTMKGNLQ